MTTNNLGEIGDAIYFTKKILRVLESDDVNLDCVTRDLKRLSLIIQSKKIYDEFRKDIIEYDSKEESENYSGLDKMKKNIMSARLITYKTDVGRYVLKSTLCKNGIEISEDVYKLMVLEIEKRIDERFQDE